MNCDLTDISPTIYSLAEEFLKTKEVEEYLALKESLSGCAEVVKLQQKFQRAKDDYEYAERFGHFHPDYHLTKERAERALLELKTNPQITAYLEAHRKINIWLERIGNKLNEAILGDI